MILFKNVLIIELIFKSIRIFFLARKVFFCPSFHFFLPISLYSFILTILKISCNLFWSFLLAQSIYSNMVNWKFFQNLTQFDNKNRTKTKTFFHCVPGSSCRSFKLKLAALNLKFSNCVKNKRILHKSVFWCPLWP